jgi:hypothetical protein
MRLHPTYLTFSNPDFRFYGSLVLDVKKVLHNTSVKKNPPLGTVDFSVYVKYQNSG